MAERQRYGCLETWLYSCKQMPTLRSPIDANCAYFRKPPIIFAPKRTPSSVICQSGLKEPDFEYQRDPLYPCSEPICNFTDGKSCHNGECIGPNTCACEIGWDGIKCNDCIDLPGCKNGYCVKGQDCNCFDGWTGYLCSTREI